MAGSKLGIVLKALRSTAKPVVKMGVKCGKQGFLSNAEIRKHDETRKAAGLPTKAEEAENKRRAASKRKRKKKKKRTLAEIFLPWNW